MSFQKSKVCFVLSYKWLIICMMKTSKQSGDNTQSVHPELKSRWGFFFLTELIICSHSFYVPNIYQSTVYLSLYLSKLKFTVNLTFQGVLFHLNKHIIHDLCLVFLIFFIFWVFLPFFLLFLFTLKIVSLKGEEFVTKSRVLMIILPFFYNLL